PAPTWRQAGRELEHELLVGERRADLLRAPEDSHRVAALLEERGAGKADLLPVGSRDLVEVLVVERPEGLAAGAHRGLEDVPALVLAVEEDALGPVAGTDGEDLVAAVGIPLVGCGSVEERGPAEEDGDDLVGLERDAHEARDVLGRRRAAPSAVGMDVDHAVGLP